MPPSPPPTAKKPDFSSLDLLQAKLALSQARTQSLVSSWLPPPTPDDLRDEADLLAHESALPPAAPPRLGLGATLPEEALDRMQRNLADEQLRRRLLGPSAGGKGRGARRTEHRGGNGSNSSSSSSVRMRDGLPKKRARQGNGGGRSSDEDDDDDEPGRSAVGRAKKGSAGGGGGGSGDDAEEEEEGGSKGGKKGGGKKFGSYFDVHKARSKPKKRKAGE